MLFTILIVSCTSWNILYFLYSRQCIFLTFVLIYIYQLMVYVNLTFLYFVIALEVLTCSMLHSNFSGKITLLVNFERIDPFIFFCFRVDPDNNNSTDLFILLTYLDRIHFFLLHRDRPFTFGLVSWTFLAISMNLFCSFIHNIEYIVYPTALFLLCCSPWCNFLVNW